MARAGRGRERRRLSTEEVDALRELLHGHRPSTIGAYAALIAAAATFVSAITSTILAVWDRIVE